VGKKKSKTEQGSKVWTNSVDFIDNGRQKKRKGEGKGDARVPESPVVMVA